MVKMASIPIDLTHSLAQTRSSSVDQLLGNDQTVRDPGRTLLCEVGPHCSDDPRLALR